MTEYSVDEVRALLRGMGGHALTVAERASLFVIAAAYADLLERIKVDEGVVPALVYLGCNNGAPRYQWNCRWNELEAGTEFYIHPPAQPAQLWEMKQRACRAHALCNELRLAHPEIPELGDDGVLHEAIHDILRVDTPTAAPAQAAQVPDGATEVIRRSLGSDGHAVSLAFRSQESADRFYTHMDEAMKVAQNTAAEPVAQGEAVYQRHLAVPGYWEDITREQWEKAQRSDTRVLYTAKPRAVLDADYVAHPRGDGSIVRKDDGSRVSVDSILAAMNSRSVPAERVVDGELRTLYAAAGKGFHVSETCGPESRYWHVSKFQTLADLFAFEVAWRKAMLKAMLAAAPQPGESNNKPADCSGDPASCPDNEGRGCYCSDLRRAGESA